jgi:TRAP-type C4-dicarboxylate transport system permease small subunit
MTDRSSSSFFERFYNAYGIALSGGAVLSSVILGITLVMVTLDVLLRNLFVSGILGVIEYTEMGLYVATVLTAPWLLREGQHIKVDLLSQFGPEPLARIADVLSDILGLVVMAIVGWYAFLSMRDSYLAGSVMRRSINFPEWLLLLPLVISMALLAGEFLLHLCLSISNLRHPGKTQPTT